MVRLSKKVIVLTLLLGGSGSGFAFSLLGPYQTWQTADIGYQLIGDIGGPMTPSAGYRWNFPTITYAFDSSFINYFGTEGVKAVDKAFAILNGLPSMTQITSDGSRLLYKGRPYPMSAVGSPNGTALAAGLLDLKSYALMTVVEELGLAEPSRWTWSLRARALGTVGNQPVTNYTVRQYNYDPVTLRETNRVNSIYYSYQIVDPVAPFTYSDAVDFVSLNPDDLYSYSAVADQFLGAGYFFVGLSADDVGGLRYLYNKNNIANETLPAGVGPPTSLLNSVTDNPWLPFSYRTNVTNAVLGTIPTAWLPYLSGTNTGFLNNTNVNTGTNAGIGAIALLVATNASALVTNGLRPGVNKLTFRKLGNQVYDSILGQLYVPVTNRYVDQVITNRVLVLQPVERVITQPDILFVAEDLGLANGYLPFLKARTSTAGWQNNDAINGQSVAGGPGTIPGGTNSTVRISFSDQLPYYLNRNPVYLDQTYQTGGELWGSFDGTTNAPVVYPIYGGPTLRELVDRVVNAGN